MVEKHPIRLLSAEVANKIAAGEVVERPASVFKELLENSIDAGASHIEAVAVAGGCRLIGVTDDGAGMNRDDALLAIERHATSKIRDVADIEHIATLGFRGEALAAIAAVSRFRLQSCERGSMVGTEVLISGGRIHDVREVGCPSGTVVEVRDLFHNVPARRKFLRSAATEMAHVRQMFIVHALAHPRIAMRLTLDGREAWRLPGDARVEDRIRDLLGEEYLRQLLPVRFQSSEVALHGYVGVPSMARGDSNEQFIFINGRPASAPILHRAIREGYHSLLANGRQPVLFLFVEVDPALVDVNVHPAKREVRFRHPGEMRDAAIAAIRQALARAPSPAAVPAALGLAMPAAAAEQPRLFHIENLPATRAFRYPRLPLDATGRPPVPLTADSTTVAGGGAPDERQPVKQDESRADTETPASPWTVCRVVGQIGGLYVLLETDDGYVIMDPHAAHERVLYERFMRQYLQGQVPTQGLLVPETVELMPRDALQVRRNLDLLRKMGFSIAEFGGDAFLIDAMPAFFPDVTLRTLLADMAQHLEDTGDRGTKVRVREEAIAKAACKAAVKARDNLELTEMEQLVVDLASAEMPYTCPHGRPTLLFTSFRELRRKFGRE